MAIGSCLVLAAVMSFVLIYILDKIMGVNIDIHDELVGLDKNEIGE